MSLKVYVIFFDIKWWVSYAIRFISRAKYDHCSLLVVKENKDAEMMCIYNRSRAKFRDPRVNLGRNKFL